MKIEVTQEKDGKFKLVIGDETILTHGRLSFIVRKIEQYLKMRFLPEEKTKLGSLADDFGKMFK